MATMNKNGLKSKCKICGKMFKDIDHLVSHIDDVHYSQIFPGFTASQYEYYLRTGKKVGRCVVCGGESGWNKSTNKYHRLCSDKCREEYREVFKQRMIGKHGKVHLLDDPEQQRKMIYAKKTSGKYEWDMEDGKSKFIPYASSYEKDFLEMLETFLGFDGNDIIGPSPHNYTYTYNGTKHIYIPDYYIPSLNLEIEIKDGEGPGNNPNMHPKIQAVDKVKEKLKDEVMASNSKSINYIKIMNKNYSEFFSLILKLRGNEIATGTSGKNVVMESTVTESMTDTMLEIDNVVFTSFEEKDYSALKKSLLRRVKNCHPSHIKYMNELLDAWVDKCNKVKEYDSNHPEHYIVRDVTTLGEYITNIIKPELERRAMYLDVALESYAVDTFTNTTPDGKQIVLRPVYILLTYTDTTLAKLIKLKTHQPYSHASISLDTKLDNMYSFGRKNEGDRFKFINEDIREGVLKDVSDKASYSLYMVLITDEEYIRLQNTLDDFKSKGDKLKFNFSGLVSLAFGKGRESEDRFFCSEFIAELLRHANPNIYNKSSSLYTPTDLVKGKRFAFVKKGVLKNYNKYDVDSKIRQIMNERGFD